MATHIHINLAEITMENLVLPKDRVYLSTDYKMMIGGARDQNQKEYWVRTPENTLWKITEEEFNRLHEELTN